ncbi:MAG: saccharopine dehydrogenase family protein [Solirubrobacteraceae bacterium]
MSEREHEIVVYGATGFTGGLTAEYLARASALGAPSSLRWALAGRNRAKLEAVRARLAAIDPGLAELPLLEADAGDPASMRALAQSAKVVISTVGPYIHFGEPLVAACAAAGTDYVDLTGEPEFVDRMWLRHHAQAQRTGARLVHSCGFDSIPYDLGVLYTVTQLPEGMPLAVQGFVRAGGTFSGGTFHSAINVMGRLRQGARAARERRRLEERPEHRRVRGVAGRPHNVPAAGGWVVPFPTIDPQTVLRSARALERYGPDFTYEHYLVVKRLPAVGGLAVGAGALIALAQLPPTRNLLLKIKDPGEGPTPEQREKAWFRVRFVARTSGTGGDERIVTEVSGGDPGYGETSKMLSEAALCLARDELPQGGGQLTPAVAMGQPLITRLQAAGIEFKRVE